MMDKKTTEGQVQNTAQGAGVALAKGQRIKDIRNEEISKIFWHSVDARTKDEGISRAELSRRADLSNQSLTSAKYLKTTINIFTVMRITKALNCTVEDLLYGASSPNGHKREKCAGLIEQCRTEKGSSEIASLTKLFGELNILEQEAVLVHMFSLLGVSPKETIRKIESCGKSENTEKVDGEIKG